MAHSVMHYIKLYTFLIWLDKLTCGLVVHFSSYLQSDKRTPYVENKYVHPSQE